MPQAHEFKTFVDHQSNMAKEALYEFLNNYVWVPYVWVPEDDGAVE